jgi:hypothetical protein
MRCRVLPLLCFLVVLLTFASTGQAAVAPITAVDTCHKYRSVADGVYIQEFAATEVTGGLAGLPDRVETKLGPGESGTFCVGFHNRMGTTIQLAVRVAGVSTTDQGVPLIVDPDSTPFGAAAWVALPTTKQVTLKHGQLAWFDVHVTVPADTAGGSNYAAIIGTSTSGGAKTSSAGVTTEVHQSIAVQLFLDVNGEVETGGKLIRVRQPHVIWWDGLGGGDLPVLKKLRGLGIAPIRFAWKNTGSFTDKVGGDVRFKSSLGGKEVSKLDFPEHVVLRSSSRDYEVTWSKDIPLVGRFTPTITVRTADGRIHESKLDPIWVIPAWWYIALLIIAIAMPLWWRRRSRRRYDDLLARVEAAEARGGRADWDDAGDAWDEPR